MSILIKGMEMPTSCYKCPLRRRDGMDIVCPVAHERFSVADVNILEYRLNNCPLVPVPPHGRLGDLGRIERTLHEWESVVWDRNALQMLRDCINLVKAAHTIIPAEEVKVMFGHDAISEAYIMSEEHAENLAKAEEGET